MKKRLSVVSKAALAAQMLGVGLLLLISCANIVAPSRESGAAGNGETGTALISFGNGVEGARTLLPTGVSFERYDLTIEAVEPNNAATVNDTVTAGSTALIELDVGDWKIRVEAYTAGGLAAEGEATFTVNADTTTPVPVTLKAVSGADPGILAVDITGVDSGFIQYGYFRIYNGANYDNEVTFYNGSSDDTYAYISSNGLDLDISLPSGQYRIFAYIYNNEGQVAYINEVAWIYSNLTTNLHRVMEPGDFTDTTLISGTVQYAVNGVDQDYYDLYVYTNPGRSGYYLGQTWISYAGEQPYTFHIPRPDKNITLYFFISKDGNYFFADSVDLEAEKAEETKNINLNRSGITLSGDVTVTMGGSPVTVVEISAEGGGFSFSGSASDGAWSISGIPSDFTGTLNLRIRAQYGGQWYDVYYAGSWTSGSPTTGISLSASLTLITGSFYITENSAYIRDQHVYINAAKESDWNPGHYDEYLSGSFNYVWSGNLCTWYFAPTTTFPSSPTRVQFNFSIDSRQTPGAVVTVNASSGNAGQRTYAFIALGGSIGAVTVGVNPVESVYISAFSEQNYAQYPGRISIEDGAWTIYGIPSNFSGTLTIRINALYGNESYSNDNVATWNSGASPTGIDLGDIDFTPYITLSGTIGTVTVGVNTPDQIWVYTGGYGGQYWGSVEGNSWTIRGIPDDFSGTLAIYVEAQYNEEVYHSPSVGSWTSGTAVTDIYLEGVNFTPYITLSGSVAVTVNGNEPDSVEVSAYQEGGDYNKYWGFAAGGSWMIGGIPPDFSGTLAITVNALYDSEWYYSEAVGSWTSGTPVTDIDLGSIDFIPNITLSGTIGTVTVGGNTAYNANIYVVYPESGGGGANAPGGFSSISGNTWTITGIPGDFSGTLTIMAEAGYNGGWYSKAVGSWTSGTSTTIDLGNINFTPNIILSGTIGTVRVNGNTASNVSIYARTSDNGNYYSGSVDGGNWQIQFPSDFSGTVDIGVYVEYNGRGHSKDAVATRTISNSSPASVGLGNVNITYITLSGIIGTVTVNGQTPSDVYIYARDSNNDGQYQVFRDGSAWEIELPSGFTGSVTIGVQAVYNGRWHSKEFAPRTVSGSSIGNINLGDVNITYLPLSGTIGTVTVNGQTPDYVFIYARDSGGEYYSGSVYGGSNWEIPLPGGFSGSVTIGVEAAYDMRGYSKDVTTWTSGDLTTGIALGNVEFTFTPIGGTVTTNGTTPLGEGYLAILSQPISDPEDMTEEMALGSGEIAGGNFSGYVNGDIATGYVVVVVPDFENGIADYWITTSSVTLGLSMSIDLSTMEHGQAPINFGEDPQP